MHLKLSVVILNYNVRYFLELCLKSVEIAIEHIDAEIIVIDNNSSDDSCEMLKQSFPNIQLIENKENVGFAIANNQAVHEAKGEYVCILNPDTVVAEDTFTKLLKFADDKANIGIVGCRLIDGTGQYLPESKRNVPTIKVASQKLLGNSKLYYANDVLEFETAKASVFVGAFMVLKRCVYNELEGFDEDFFMYGEDIDLSYRALKLNYNNYYFGKTTAIHFKGESTLKDKKYAKRFFEAMQIFYKKHFKTNVLFDAFVKTGIKTATLFSSKPSENRKEINKYYFVSEADTTAFEFPFDVECISTEQLENVEDNSEIIFDAHTISYKTIIGCMSNLANQSLLTFKILPNNSGFLIGSNDAINQGKILTLNKS